MSNPVAQWQIVATEPDKAASFYRGLFGWKITAGNSLGYREVAAEPGGIKGGIWPAPPEAKALVQLFVAVDNVEKSAARATELGASVIVPPTVLPDGDTMAVILDPCGMSVGLMLKR